METNTLTAAQARNALVGIRAGLGVGTLLAPRLTGRLFGIDPGANPAAVYLARLFGARELFMVAPFLFEDADDLQRYALEAGVVVDATDAVAAMAAGARGGIGKRAAAMATVVALLAVGLGLTALQDE